MRVMVTGGTGFLGSHSVVALLKAGYDVRLLVRSETKMRRLFAQHGVEIKDFVVGDVTDDASVARALEGCDAVIHSAAMVATAKKYADLVHRTNVGGTKSVINQALDKGIERIIHVSSVTAIYNPDCEQVNEESPPGKAHNAYGRSKVECEHFVRGLQEKGAPIAITYPTGVIGPYDPALTEPLAGLQYFLSKPPVITTTGIQFVDVRDCADINILLLNRPAKPERFAIGGFYYPWGELVSILEELTGRSLKRIPMPPRLLMCAGYLADVVSRISGLDFIFTKEAATYATRWSFVSSDKLLNELDFKFRSDRQTMKDTLRWMAEAGHLKPQQIGRLSHG